MKKKRILREDGRRISDRFSYNFILSNTGLIKSLTISFSIALSCISRNARPVKNGEKEELSNPFVTNY